MADPNNKLPEGTDAIIGGAGSGGGTGGTGRSGTAGSAATTSTQTNATGGQTRTTDSSDATDALITGGGTSTGAANAGNSALGSSGTTGGTAGLGGAAGVGGAAGSGGASGGTTASTGTSGSTGGATGSNGGGSSKGSGVRGLVSNAGGKLRDEGKNKIHSLASQGLQQGSSTLTNIAGIVDDTVQQIEERLGPQYGEYARKASQAINGYATTLQNKNPDELVEDARALVRKSPAVALTGAAVLGFGLVRLLKVGLEESQYGAGDRNNDRTSTAG